MSWHPFSDADSAVIRAAGLLWVSAFAISFGVCYNSRHAKNCWRKKSIDWRRRFLQICTAGCKVKQNPLLPLGITTLRVKAGIYLFIIRGLYLPIMVMSAYQSEGTSLPDQFLCLQWSNREDRALWN